MTQAGRAVAIAMTEDAAAGLAILGSRPAHARSSTSRAELQRSPEGSDRFPGPAGPAQGRAAISLSEPFLSGAA